MKKDIIKSSKERKKKLAKSQPKFDKNVNIKR